MKTILLLGAGKSSSVLIDYLLEVCEINKWKFIIGDANINLINSKIKKSKFAEAIKLDITNEYDRSKIIQRTHVVISMMPPSLHFLIAKDCVEYRKHLLTASYIDSSIKSLQEEIKHKKLLFLCEMGLDPGIDHMSAMKIIDKIKNEGGSITSFKSHCGGLISPESDNNPWHYKISWNPRNVVLAGKSGAIYKEDDIILTKNYNQIFNDCNQIKIDELPSLAFYPNRDSLSYASTYKLQSAKTFIRTTLRYPIFCTVWNALVQSGLTNDSVEQDFKNKTYLEWSVPILPFIDESNQSLLSYLGIFEKEIIPQHAKTSADVLQYLLETKLAMQPNDKDMIVMLHEIKYELNGKQHEIKSSLVVIGENSLHTAMAKTVGLPLGIAAKLILNNEIKLTGLYIPTEKEIYIPVLNELNQMGINFKEKIM